MKEEEVPNQSLVQLLLTGYGDSLMLFPDTRFDLNRGISILEIMMPVFRASPAG